MLPHTLPHRAMPKDGENYISIVFKFTFAEHYVRLIQ